MKRRGIIMRTGVLGIASLGVGLGVVGAVAPKSFAHNNETF